MDEGKTVNDRYSVLGVAVSAHNMDTVVDKAIRAAHERTGLSISALAVHGIMLAVSDSELRTRINRLDIVTPDGQPVRWALNILYRTRLQERIYGPDLMLEVCARARDNGLSIFMFGSTHDTLAKLARNLKTRFPDLAIVGMQPSRFRSASADERASDLQRITESGADIVFVGLGCPRQEVWAYENTQRLSLPVIAVGAAFDYHAGLKNEPPKWIQRAGIQWLHRLVQEPRRLYKRYLLLNPAYITLLLLQAVRLRRFPVEDAGEPVACLRPS